MPALEILIGFSPGRSAPNVPEDCSFKVNGSLRACGSPISPDTMKSDSPACSLVGSIAMFRVTGSKWNPPETASIISGS